MISIQTNEYPIKLGRLEESGFGELLNKHYKSSKIVIVVDENSHDYCLEFLITSFDILKEAEVMLLPAGEENKVMEVCFQVWEALTDYQVGRKDLIINLGGGVVTDMGGFIASVYKRGIDFINIPTTLLAMVDASIGGKTGIDLGPYKNQLGTFAYPKALFIDARFLHTLPQHELLNGYAEMLKHALISDAEYWKLLIQKQDIQELIDLNLIETSVNIKNKVVTADPKESGLRKILNFGHTIGHGLEGYFLDKEPISHGHAVGLGMLGEAYISHNRGILSTGEWKEITEVLLRIFPLVELNENEFDTVINLMSNDKKNFEGEIKGCLLSKIGTCVFDQNYTKEEIKEALLQLAIDN